MIKRGCEDPKEKKLASGADSAQSNCVHIDFKRSVEPITIQLANMKPWDRDSIIQQLGLEVNATDVFGYRRGQRCQCYDQLEGVPMYKMFFDKKHQI